MAGPCTNNGPVCAQRVRVCIIKGYLEEIMRTLDQFAITRKWPPHIPIAFSSTRCRRQTG